MQSMSAYESYERFTRFNPAGNSHTAIASDWDLPYRPNQSEEQLELLTTPGSAAGPAGTCAVYGSVPEPRVSPSVQVRLPWPGTLPNRCIGIGRRLTPQESDGCETTADGGEVAADRFSP